MKVRLFLFLMLCSARVVSECAVPNCIDCGSSGWSTNNFSISNSINEESIHSLSYLASENPYKALNLAIDTNVTPTVTSNLSSGFEYPRWYLSQNYQYTTYLVSGPLTNLGPVGPYGALSSWGPIGKSAWNPTTYIDEWAKFYGTFFKEFDYFVKANGPLTISGPLGSSGPYTTSAYCSELPAINDFGKHLQAGGIWSILGPAGPLGPVGPLGPLGPNGTAAVLYPPDSNGNYIDPNTKAVVDSVTIYESDNKTVYRAYPLYELYNANYAQSRVNDMSWMVSDATLPAISAQSWRVKADSDQYVSVLALMNEATESNLIPLIIAVEDMTTGVQLVSALEPSSKPRYQYTSQLFFRAQEGHEYNILIQTFSTKSVNYRLLVTGSTEYLNGSDISGDHQLSYSSLKGKKAKKIKKIIKNKR